MTIDPIEITAVLDTLPEHAFWAFVRKIGKWWPLSTHSVSHAMHKTVASDLEIEPGLGGRIIEHGPNDEIHVWGTITVWEEFSRIDCTWHVGRTPDLATRLSIRFQPTDDGRTGITLIHSDWDVLGEDGLIIRNRNAGGWGRIIGTLFANYVHDHCPPQPANS